MPILPPETQRALFNFWNIFLMFGFWSRKSWAPNLSMAGPRPLLGVRLWTACGNTTLRVVPTCLNYCVIFIVYTIYKRSREPHNTARRGAEFETHVISYFVLISALCHMTHQQTTRFVRASHFCLNFLSRKRVTTRDSLAHKQWCGVVRVTGESSRLGLTWALTIFFKKSGLQTQYFVGSLVSHDRIVSNDLCSKQSVCNASRVDWSTVNKVLCRWGTWICEHYT